MAISVLDTSSNYFTTTSSETVSYNNDVGSNCLVVAVCVYDSTDANRAIDTITYNSEALTVEQTTNYDGVDQSVYICYLTEPATGTNDLVVTLDGSCEDLGIVIYSLSGINIAAAVDAKNSNTSSTTYPTVSVTTNYANSLLIDAVYTGQNSVSEMTVGTGQTAAAQQDTGFEGYLSSYKAVTTATSYTMEWDDDETNDSISAVVAFRESAGSVTPTPSAQTLALAVQAPSVVVDAAPGPAAQTLALTVQAPTVDVTGSVTPTPSAQTLALAAQAPSVLIDATPAPAAQDLSVTVNAPSVVITGTLSLKTDYFGVVIETLSLKTDYFGVSGGISVTPEALSLTLAVMDTTIAADCKISPAVLALALSQLTSTVAAWTPKKYRRAGAPETKATRFNLSRKISINYRDISRTAARRP